MSTLTTRTRTRLAAAALVALAGLATAAPHAAADPVQLRIATLAPPGSTWMKKLDRGSEAIKQKTGSRVSLQWYPGGTQGDERDFVRKMRMGQLDGAAVTAIGLSMIDPAIRVLEVPGLFRSVDEYDYVSNKMWPLFQKKFRAEGYILADRGEVGWFYFMSKTPIASLADLQGKKVWLWGDDIIMKTLYKQLGVKDAVPLGAPEVDSALVSGRIAAIYGSPLAAVALQWSTKVRYWYDLKIGYSMGATVMTKKSFDKLSAADQRTTLKLMEKTGREIRKAVRRDNADAGKQMKQKGVHLAPASAAEQTKMETVGQAVAKELTGKVFPKEYYDQVVKYRDEYRAKHH